MAQFNRHLKFVHYRGDDCEIISKIASSYNSQIDRTRKGEPSIKSAISSLQRAHAKLAAVLRSNEWQWFVTITFDNVDHFVLTKLIEYDKQGGLNFSSLHRLVLFEFPKHTVFLTQDYFRTRLKRLLDKHYIRKVEKKYFITDRGRDNVPDRKDDCFCRKAFSRWSRDMRSKLPNMYYVSVPEYHGAGGIHFHVVVGGVSAAELGLVDSGLVLHNGKPIQRSKFIDYGFEYDLPSGEGATVYNVSSWKIGFTTATEVRSSEAVTWYVGKYMSKANIDPRFYNKKRYYVAKSTRLPCVTKICVDGCKEVPIAGCPGRTYFKKVKTCLLDLKVLGSARDPLCRVADLQFHKSNTGFTKYRVKNKYFKLRYFASYVPSKT